MNATKYYVAACRLVIQANPDSLESWQDIYRVLPMLRNSLSCTVCERLLSEPYTPEETSCQHHVCKGCRGGTKVIRCSWCKDYTKYAENVQIRILLQSYRKLCALVKVTRLYTMISENKEHGQTLIDILRETDQTSVPSGSSNSIIPSQIFDRTKNNMTSSCRSENSAINMPIKREIQSEDEEEEAASEQQQQVNIPPKNVIRPGSISSWQLPSPAVRDAGPGVKRRRSSTASAGNDSAFAAKSFDGYENRISRCDSEEELGINDHVSQYNSTGLSLDERRVDISDEITSSPLKKMRRDSSHDQQNVCEPSEVLTELKRELPEEGPSLAPALQTDTDVDTSPALTEPTARLRQERILEVKTDPDKLSDTIKEEFSFRSPPISRCETPSPPNVAKYSASQVSPRLSPATPSTIAIKPRVKQFVLQPRTLAQESSGLEKAANSSSVQLGWAGSRIKSVLSATPHLLPRAADGGRSLLKPSHLQTESLTESKPVVGKKAGCRCGNATACPGKLTCCGQRCPCYVSRMACIGCRCKGCNNPTLPGGGKVLPYINAALNLNGTLGVGKPKRSLIRTSSGPVSLGSNVVRVPSSTSGESMTDVDINTIPVVNISSPNSFRTFSNSAFIRLNKTVPTLGGKPVTYTRTAGMATSTATSSSSTLTSVRVVPASSLSTVSIPLNSISAAAGGLSAALKLKPLDQLQHKEIKARVIPTSFRLKTAPYTRVPVSGKVPGGGAIRLQTVSLMSLLQNAKDKQIQIERKKEESTDINVDS